MPLSGVFWRVWGKLIAAFLTVFDSETHVAGSNVTIIV